MNAVLAEFSFAAPAVLVAALAAAFPLVLHLLGRSTAAIVEFPALRFVRAAAVKTAHRRRLENVALLVFRMSLFALLPVALGLPFYRSAAVRFAGGTTGHLALAIVLDNTASMNQKAGGRTAFALAKRQALRLLRGTDALAAPETAILLCPVAAQPVVTSNLEQLSEQVRALEATGAEADLVPAIKLAQTLLTTQPAPNKLIYVLTDLQKSGLRPDELRTMDVPVALLDVHVPADNLGITDVVLSTPVIANRPVTFTVRLGGSLGTARNVSLRLSDDKDRGLHSQDLICTGSVAEPISFDLVLPSPGRFHGRLDLGLDDQLAIDNRWYLAVQVNPPVPVLICSDAPSGKAWTDDPAFFLRAALNAPGWISPRTVARLSPADLKGENVVYYPQTARLDISALDSFLKTGGRSAVLFTSLTSLEPVLERLGLGTTAAVTTADEPATVDQTDAADPLLAALGFKSSIYHQIAVSRYVKLAPAPGAEALLVLSSGDPLLVKRRIGRSTVYAFTTPAQVNAGTLPISPAFPAILAQIAADTVPADSAFTFRAGNAFTCATNAPGKVIAPTSRPVADLRSGQNQLTLYSPGFYTSPAGVLAVNASEKATDLAAWPLSAFGPEGKSPILAADSPETLETRLNSLAQGTPLWDTILCLLLVVILAETLLANLRRPAETPS